MSKTNSVSILITRDSKLVKTYFGRENQFLQKSVTFTNFVEDARRDKKTLIYSTDNSKNIISLTHSTVEDNESKGNYRGLITVELIDPDLKFEEDFVRMNISEVFVDFLKKELQNTDTPERESSFTNYVSETLASGNVANDTFYIAYGNTDNLETWAGPFICKFSDAQIRYSGDSARKLILYFVYAKSPMSCSMGVFGDTLPLTLYRSNYYAVENKTVLISDPLQLDFSELIYSLYEGYLKQCYADQANIIVLLPEIKTFYLQQIRGILTKNLIQSKEEINRRRPVELYLYPGFEYQKLDILAVQKNAIAEVLTDFGLYVSYSDKESFEDAKKLVAGVKEQRAEYKPTKKITEYTISLRANLTNNFWIEYYEPIKKLRDLLARFGFETVFYEESNTKVLTAWEEAGLIKDSKRPTVVLGDFNLVSDFLYGKYGSISEGLASVSFSLGSFGPVTRGVFDNFINFKRKEFLDGFITLNLEKFNSTETEFVYDSIADENNNRRQQILGTAFSLRKVDLEKFRQAKLWTKLKNLTSQYVYQYGELEKTGILAIDKKLTEIDLRRGKTGNFPVFRFNIPNPNVVKLDLDSKNSYYTALFATIQRLLYDYPSRFIEPTIKPGGKTDPDTTIFRHIVEIANKFLKTGREDLEIEEAKKLVLPFINQNSLVKEKPETVATRWALLLITYIEDRKRKFGPTIELSDWDGSEILGLKKTFSDLMKQINTVRIRTLPMFQISKLSDLFSTAYLLADTVDVYGYSETIMSEVLSNEYRILGFKHFINKEECYSEFILALDPNTAGTKKMMGL